MCSIRSMRTTQTLLKVAGELMRRPRDKHWGNDIRRRVALSEGTVYPVLNRFRKAGWIVDTEYELPDQLEGRPPRRYFTLTDTGRDHLGRMLADQREREARLRASVVA